MPAKYTYKQGSRVGDRRQLARELHVHVNTIISWQGRFLPILRVEKGTILYDLDLCAKLAPVSKRPAPMAKPSEVSEEDFKRALAEISAERAA